MVARPYSGEWRWHGEEKGGTDGRKAGTVIEMADPEMKEGLAGVLWTGRRR